MKDAEHRDLARVLNRVKGKVSVGAPPKNCHSIKKTRTEALWMNY
jgi:hypothetical protein